MTQEGYEYNLKRVCFFYNQKANFKYVQDVWALPQNFAKVLDVNGAPIDSLSILLLTQHDYVELVNHFTPLTGTELQHSNNIFSNPSCSFSYLGYSWQVKMIDHYPTTKTIIE